MTPELLQDDPSLLQVTRRGLETFPRTGAERFASSERAIPADTGMRLITE